MKVSLYTLNVNGFSPEITDLTFPLLKRYAEKIEAEFVEIKERCYPEMPAVYEKFQIHRLMEERGDDWALFWDADALVHPDLPNLTELISPDTVAHNGVDFGPVRWQYDDYLRRDGRHISSCTWCVICPRMCRDLWQPLTDLTLEQAVARIFPIQNELNTTKTPTSLIDDFVLSRNIARYGLKFVTLTDLFKRWPGSDGGYFWHAYTIPPDEKLVAMRAQLKTWGLRVK